MISLPNYLDYSKYTFIMDGVGLEAFINQLDDDIDGLEDALGLLLGGALSEAAGKLPLLDRAKLYVLVTYAIESLLFCWSLAFR